MELVSCSAPNASICRSNACTAVPAGKNGVRDPDRLCERVLDDLRKLPRTL
jgi:hypothetical protein